jgi:hypothetical protein
MNKENSMRLSVVLSVSLICLGLSQWFDPAESPMRWKWLQDFTNNLLGEHGHAKFLIFSGGIWTLWNLVAAFKNSLKGEGK